MFMELIEALYEALEFRDVPPESITRIDANVGFIWFKAGELTYCLHIEKVEFNLDEQT